jgi:hypothetical protein
VRRGKTGTEDYTAIMRGPGLLLLCLNVSFRLENRLKLR